MKRILQVTCLTYALCASSAFAESAALTVTAEGIGKDGYIAEKYAFCVPAAEGHIKGGDNNSIGLSWTKGPAGTKSYAIIAVDPDVPAVFDDAGKEGKTLPADMKRKDFYHWVFFDIPVFKTSFAVSADSQKAEEHGKSQLRTPYGTRGVNDYAAYFASDPKHAGVYAGYDGPCPPWNDLRVHHYHFKVFALDVSKLDLSGEVTGVRALRTITPHILAQGEVVGKYSLNPDLKKE